ncbi:MAG: Stk1 family PASTA domain-containing Ser/Thr kinase [Clostridia bacterium]|nr:Stk1 family PASTA domain-containing Ser/Thr kinase [Clostridia bacterium]
MNLIGKMLANRYEILEKIGNGGMATVYRAKCHVLNRYVAIKILKDEFITDNEFIKRFKTEAQSAASLTHPNIVSIYDVGNEGDIYYIVMELIQGKTLKEIIVEDGKLSWKWSVNIAIQIASALEMAHKNNIIHRDIKPHNIIITEDGMAKVTDFGIAKAVSNSTITAFGTTIGSVHYFSPEHAKGGFTDAKSDIYSLGVVMYEMLTGRVPFDADTPVSVALMQVQEEPIEPKKLNPQIPVSVNKIILKAMQKDPDDRYQNATDMLIDLSTSLKRPNDDFVHINKEYDGVDTQKLSTLYDLDSKTRDDEEDDDDDYVPKRSPKKKKRRGLIGFFKNHVIISVFLLGILVFGTALGGTVLFMNATKDVEIQIPNLVTNEKGEKLTEDEAKKIYKDSGFKKDLKVEYVVDEKVEVGKVIKQEPKYQKNYKVKEDEQFTIYVSKEKDVVKAKMIDVVGKEKTEAEKLLREAGFKKFKFEEENSETLKEGLVTKQSVEKDQEIDVESEITITVSKGTSKIKVPSVIGSTEEEAKVVLETAGFEVEIEYGENSSETDGKVIKQSVSASDMAEEGETIVITVNKIEKTKSVSVTIDLSKYMQESEHSSDTDEKETSKKKSTVSLKVGDEPPYGGDSYSATDKPTITIYGKGNSTVALMIDGNIKEKKDINFNTQTTLAFP